MSERRPDKMKILWVDSLVDAACNLGSVIGFLGLFLNFTSVLWAPQNWFYWLQWIFMASENPTFVDVEPMIGNPSPPCLTYEAKKEAVGADPGDVSGWYGPGAYLAWLFTIYVASVSSIWNTNISSNTYEVPTDQKKDEVATEGVLLAALIYPAIALLILYTGSLGVRWIQASTLRCLSLSTQS
ncbi:hypothetical protein BU23DRAFT_642589 [Bimuria novae-zelandiae CBS 107.79]|uniref:Uncharacterized protein n=1 Tax=Bimuria novae-zelandiae CBS 107.79 TaxID=1447943 RepID=A0A6A5VU71_9PLEO|nr:hypothetical protein BU23DRAFT_642589 [Bimuria novae-zelandiae CBS 107.79]